MENIWTLEMEEKKREGLGFGSTSWKVRVWVEKLKVILPINNDLKIEL